MVRKRGVKGGRKRRARVFLAAALPIGVPLLFAAFAFQPSAAPALTAALTFPDLRYEDLFTPVREDLPEHSFVLTFEEQDTLDRILQEGGLTRRESYQLTNELARHVDARRLRPGHLLRFHRDRSGAIDSVQMRVSGWGELQAQRNGSGLFEVTPRPAHYRHERSTIAAVVDRSLYDALRAQGEGAALMQQLVDVFQWDIDFFRLQRGDAFSLVVDKRFAGSELVGYGPILAARFSHAGMTFEAFRHEKQDGTSGYYTRAATPVRKQFLRAPLKFTRITSGFSKRRFHPVLHYFRPHYGVDYGAPTGTPVMTTADGVVVEAGRRRGEGNFIRIKHNARMETQYLHLSRFAKGLQKGSKVLQGDVIGYVGMTGLATGPHLDYRVRESGKWLDPLKLKSITPDPLSGESLRRFRGDVAALAPRLESQPVPLTAEAERRRALF